MITLNSQELSLFGAILDSMSYNLDSQSVRLKAAQDLLTLLNADHYASYTWSSDQGAFQDGVYVNMSEKNLQQYSSYYQFRDPITHQLQQFNRAVSVNEVIDQKELLQTEFYNDFLKSDGLYWGVNLYAYAGQENIGDIRIWRSREKGNFTERELAILDLIKPVFTNSLQHCQTNLSPTEDRFSNNYLMEYFQLTPRESEVARAVFEGKMDERIAADLNISFTTVRTHLKNIYRKLSVCNRASLVNLIISADLSQASTEK